tara:strand:- start:15502 stop:15609 length:108 start_codon:yes stop_codon:yes gene_type:complete
MIRFIIDLIRTLAEGLTQSGYLPSPVDRDDDTAVE